MNLNSDKCVVLHCTRSNTPLLTQYYINDKPLTAVDQYTYLGVTLHKLCHGVITFTQSPIKQATH